uniref:Protein TIFY 5B-like n=1 Tax=Cicer arietinum TaxID=3827 RepID=A0A1S2YBX4_CICAR|nr:protein TIFY 5B-like [Cicer arietinum]
MKRNCFLGSSSHKSMNEKINVRKEFVAIAHNGHLMFDESELQARVIIWLASQKIEGKNGSKGSRPILSLSLQLRALFMHNSSQGFSIKRSLHNFLQKRKKRTQSHDSIVIHDNDNISTN